MIDETGSYIGLVLAVNVMFAEPSIIFTDKTNPIMDEVEIYICFSIQTDHPDLR